MIFLNIVSLFFVSITLFHYPRFSVHFSVFGRIVLATAATAGALNDGRQQDVSYVDSLHIPHKQL